MAPPQNLLRRAGQHLARRPSPYLRPVAAHIQGRIQSSRLAFIQFEHTANSYYLKLAGKIPTVLSLHNVDSDMLRTLAAAQTPGSLAWLRMWNRFHAMRVTERRAAKAADAVLCVSTDDASAFEHIARRRVLVPNGVDDEFFDVPAELPSSDSVIFVGKFDYEPNAIGIVRFLREGWPRVLGRKPRARLRLVGPGMGDKTATLARSTPGVEVVGPVERVDAALADATVNVVPIWQGGGTRLKVLEGLAAARPVVGTSLGVSGIGFEADRHGLVAETPATLADAIVALLTDRPRAVALARAGRQLAEQFRWQRTLRPAEELYRAWIERARSGPVRPADRDGRRPATSEFRA